MAALKFDDAPEVGGQPAGSPSVPISQSNISDEELRRRAPPSPPISQSNIDTRGMKFDDAPEASEAQKSVARIRDIARKARSTESYAPGPADYVADSASLSTVRPITAAIGAATSSGKYPDTSFGERYQGLVRYINDRAARAGEATPFAPVVGAVAQLPATMMTFGRGAAPATTTRIAGEAAIPGFVEGAAQNAESLGSAAEGGTKNALLSAGVAAGANKATNAALPAARRGAEAEATAARGASPDEIIAKAKTHFNVLDNNGIEYSARQTANLYQGLHQLRNSSVYVPGANAAMDNLFGDLMSRSRQGMTFNDLDNARSAIAKLARGPDETTRVSARAVNNEIDRMIGSGPPAVNPNGVNVQDAYNQARTLWRQKSMVEDAMFHADNVDRKLAINSEANPNKAMKAEFGGGGEAIRQTRGLRPAFG